MIQVVGKLPSKLTKCSVKKNRLPVLPLALTQSASVEVVLASGNCIVQLPAEIGGMKALQTLDLDDNYLQEIPAELGMCPKLNTLSLRRNNIRAKAGDGQQSLPKEILAQSNVNVLNLHGNPLTKQELFEMKGVDAFLERRTKLKNKEIHGGLHSDTSVCGLDS